MQPSSSGYNRNWKVTLFGVLATQGFGLAVGSMLWFAVQENLTPELRAQALRYPTFAGGLPDPFPVGSTEPIVIAGLSSWYWAIVGGVIGVVFLALALRYKRMPAKVVTKKS